MPATNDWDPRSDGSRAADTTASIHQVIAFIYGILGLIMFVALAVSHSWTGVVLMGLFFGAFTAVHAALAAGARRRSDGAKVGSIVVGVLMLLGFPIGTLVGGFLIYNASRNWPPRRDPRAGPAMPAGPDMRLG